MDELNETQNKDEEFFITPPFDDEDFDLKMIALSYSQAREELEKKTASSQIVTHFLTLGSPATRLKNEQMRLQNELLIEKIKSEKEMQRMSGMVDEVLKALQSYIYVPPGATDDHIL